MPARVFLLNVHGVNTVVAIPETVDASPEDIVDLYDDVNVAASCKLIAECGPGETLMGATPVLQPAAGAHGVKNLVRRDFDAFFELPSIGEGGPEPAPWEEFAERDGTFVYDCTAEVESAGTEEDEPPEDFMSGLMVVHHGVSRTTAVRRLPAMPVQLVEKLPCLTIVVHATSKDTSTLDYLHQKMHRAFWGDMHVHDLASWARAVLGAPIPRTDPLDRHVCDFLSRNCRFDDPNCKVSVADLEAQLLDTFNAAMDHARAVVAMHSELRRRGVIAVSGMFRGTELVTTRKGHVDVAGCFKAEVSARASDFYGC